MHRWLAHRAPGGSSRTLLLAVAAACLLSAPAQADVTVQERTVSSGLGGFGNGTSTTTMVIAGDKSRSDEEYTYTGRMKTLVGGKPRKSSTIVRLDRGVIWDLDHAKKEYSELTFAEMSRMMSEGMASMQAQMSDPQTRQAMQNIEMSYKVDVQRTGRKETVNGFAAEQVIVTLVATPKDKSQPGAPGMGAYTMKMDQWLSTAVPGQAEVTSYYRQWAEKMGLDPQMQRMGRAMAGPYAAGFKQMAEKLKDLKGVPVRSTVTVDMDATAGMSPEQKAEMQKAQADAEASRASAKQKRDEQDKRETGSDAAASAATGDVGGALGGFLARKLGKAAENKVEKSVASPGGSGGGSAFTSTTDMLSVSTGAGGASFELPAGYKKVERKQPTSPSSRK